MNIKEKQILKDVYAVIADLWCSPSEIDSETKEVRRHTYEIINRLKSFDQESALLLLKFMEKGTIREEDYVDLFELNPQCPLYLGSHTYDEPKTCANAAISDRNKYMIELAAIYKHFGQQKDGKELSDYLPLMVDFLSLSTESRDDPIRDKFIKEYFLPFIPPMRSQLKKLKTNYLYLLDALEKILNKEIIIQPHLKQQEQKV
jgi:nitrate reductase molybdenum cofactor assembly chaperone